MPGVDYGDKIVGMIDGEKREFAKGSLSPEVQQKVIAKMGGVEKAPAGSVDVSLQDVKDFSRNLGDLQGNLVTDTLNPWKLSGRILDAGKAVAPAVDDAVFAGLNYAKNTLGFNTKGDEMDRVSELGTRATLTPQAQAELANPGSQPEMQPEQQPQQDIPPYLARPGTPQGMVANAIQGQTPQQSASVRASSAGGGGGNGGGLMKGMDAAFKSEKDANLLAAQVGQRKAAEQAGYEQERLKLMQQQAAQQATFEDRAKTERDTQLAKVSALNDKLKAIDTTINPDHFWASKNTGQKITAAMAVFLGGLGGGQNRALDILNNAVQQDIEAQRATAQFALEKGQKAIENQKSIYSQYLQNLGDDRAAMLASQVSALGIVGQRINALGAKYAAPEMQAKVQAANAAIDQRSAQAKSELATRLEQLGIQRAELSMKREEHQATLATKLAKVANGKELPATEAANLAQLQTAKGMLDDLSTAFDKKTGGASFIAKYLPGTDSGRYGNDKLAAAQAVGTILEGGKLTEGDLKDKYLPLVPDASDSKETKAEKISSLKRILQKNYDGRLQGFSQAGYDVSGFPNGNAAAAYLGIRPR